MTPGTASTSPTPTAAELHRRSTVFITHDHRPIGEDIPLMLAGGVTAKVYQVTLDVDIEAGVPASANRKELWLRQAVASMDEALRDIDAHRDRAFLATGAADIERAKREGKIAILLGTEGTRWLEGSLAPLRLFHRLGLRELQLAWAFPNEIVPSWEAGGLSDFGREVIRECNRLGIVVDLTHIHPTAFMEACELSSKPLIVSHGAAAGVTVDLSDAQLKTLAKTGGLLGVHFYITYLTPEPTLEGLCNQVRYIANLVGIDHVALGVDFFPTQGAWRKMQGDQGAFDIRWCIEDMSQMPRVTEALLAHGFSESDVEKVLGQNALRVFREVIGS
jgi:membrane dipeptidase